MNNIPTKVQPSSINILRARSGRRPTGDALEQELTRQFFVVCLEKIFILT